MKRISKINFICESDNVELMTPEMMKEVRGGGSGLTVYQCNDNTTTYIPYGTCNQGNERPSSNTPYWVSCICFTSK